VFCELCLFFSFQKGKLINDGNGQGKLPCNTELLKNSYMLNMSKPGHE